MSKIVLCVTIIFSLSLAACGGGGGGSSASPQSQTTSIPDPTSYASNQVPVYVDTAYHNNVNIPYTSVTVCIPGSASCQTIPNILIDTGSTGLRIFSSAMTLTLPRIPGSTGTKVECSSFASGAVWGPLASADVRMNGEIASNTPIQIIADPAYPIPTTSDSNCYTQSPVMAQITTPQDFFANGVLGIGPMKVDCGIACQNSATNATYYNCTGSTCTGLAVNQSDQIINPVANFAVDNNGSSLSFPGVAATGATSVQGILTFGIGTQSNNDAGSTQVLTLDGNFNIPHATLIQSSSNLATYSENFFDSGSNGIFFNAPGSAGLTSLDGKGWYAPASPGSFSVFLQGVNTVNLTLPFTIAKVSSQTGAAASQVGAPIGYAGWFDLGMPFFFGRTIFTAIEGQSTPQGAGPYFAL